MKQLLKTLIVLATLSNVLCLDIGSLLGLRRNWQDDLSDHTVNPEIVEIVRWRQPVCIIPGPNVPSCLASLRKYQDEYERNSSDGAEDNLSIESKSASTAEKQVEGKKKRHIGHYHSDRVARIITPEVTDRIHMNNFERANIESSEGTGMDYHLVIGSTTPLINDAHSHRDGRYLVISNLERKKVSLTPKRPTISVTKVLNSPVTATLVAKNCFPDIGVPLCDDYHETLTIFKDTAPQTIADKQDRVRPFSEYFNNIHKFGGSSHSHQHGASLSFELNKSHVKNHTAVNEKPEGLLAQKFPHVFNRPNIGPNVPSPEIVNIIISTPAAEPVKKTGGSPSASANAEASFSSSVHSGASFLPFPHPGPSFSSSVNAGGSFSSSHGTGTSSSSSAVTTIHQTEIKPHVSIFNETARPIEIGTSSPKPGFISSLLNINKPSIFAGFGFSLNKNGVSTETPIAGSTGTGPSESHGPPDVPTRPADSYGPPHTGSNPIDSYGPPHTGVPAEFYGPPHTGVPAGSYGPPHTGVPAESYGPPHTGVPAEFYGPPKVPTSTQLPDNVSTSPEVTRKPIVQKILGILKHKSDDSNKSTIHDIGKKPIIQAISGIFHKTAVSGELSLNVTKNSIVHKTEGPIVKPEVIHANDTDLKPIIVVQPTQKPGLFDHLWNTGEGILDKLSLHKGSQYSGQITVTHNQAQSSKPFVEVPEKTKFSEIFFKPETDISGRPSLDGIFDRTHVSQQNAEDRVAPPTKAPGIFGEFFSNPSRPTNVDGIEANPKHILGFGSSIFSRAPNKPLVIERPGNKPLLVEKPIYLTEKPSHAGGFFNFYVPSDDKPILNVDHDVIKDPVYVYEKPQSSGVLSNIFGSSKPFGLFQGWAIFKNKEINISGCKGNCTTEKNFRRIPEEEKESIIAEKADNGEEKFANPENEEFSTEKMQPEKPVESEEVPDETEKASPSAVTEIEEFSVDSRDNSEKQSSTAENREIIDENKQLEKSAEGEKIEAVKSVEDETKQLEKAVEDENKQPEKSVEDEKNQPEKSVVDEKVPKRTDVPKHIPPRLEDFYWDIYNMRKKSSIPKNEKFIDEEKQVKKSVDDEKTPEETENRSSSAGEVSIEEKSVNTENEKFIEKKIEPKNTMENGEISEEILEAVDEKIVDTPEIELPTNNDTIVTLVEDKPKNLIEESTLPVEDISGKNSHDSSHESAKTLVETLGKTIAEEPVVDKKVQEESENSPEVDIVAEKSEELINKEQE